MQLSACLSGQSLSIIDFHFFTLKKLLLFSFLLSPYTTGQSVFIAQALNCEHMAPSLGQ